jgi:hypothetical protein
MLIFIIFNIIIHLKQQISWQKLWTNNLIWGVQCDFLCNICVKNEFCARCLNNNFDFEIGPPWKSTIATTRTQLWNWDRLCHNCSLGLTTKAKVCNFMGQEWSPGVTFHARGSVRECEGMNPHTPKWSPTLGVGVPMDFRIFKGRLQGSNSWDCRIPCTIEKILERRCLKWDYMAHLGT